MNTMKSIRDLESGLLEKYREFQRLFPEHSVEFVQRRFADYGIFPKLGWDLLSNGVAEAASLRDPELLQGVIIRFVKCAHATWGHSDVRGIHTNGYDYCALVITSIYSALLGRSYARTNFHGSRPLSSNGYGAYKHTANLMVCLENPCWPHAAKGIAKATSYVSAKSTSMTDAAFVSYFFALVQHDPAQASEALAVFNSGYARSDWGRHKPRTRSTFLQALAAYGRSHLVASTVEVDRQWLPPDEAQLWGEFLSLEKSGALSEKVFAPPLDFLDSLPNDEPEEAKLGVDV